MLSASHNLSLVQAEFRNHKSSLQGGFALLVSNEEAAETTALPAAWPDLKQKLLSAIGSQRNVHLAANRLHSWLSRRLAIAA